ncbi:hypothetical protein GC174_11700 [bacterium]|nr:hypothetical protein [bacterium]
MTAKRIKIRTAICLLLAITFSVPPPASAGSKEALDLFHRILVQKEGNYTYQDKAALMETLEKTPQSSIELLVKELDAKHEQSSQTQEESEAKIRAREIEAYTDLLLRLCRKDNRQLSEKSTKALLSMVDNRIGLDSEKSFDPNSLKKRLVDILGTACADKYLDQTKCCLVKGYNNEFSPYAQIYIATALADLCSRGRSRTDSEARRIFLTMLKSDCPGLRRGGAEGLKSFASKDIDSAIDTDEAPLAVTALLAPLQDNYLMVRKAAAYSLRDCGPEAAVALPVLARAAETESDYSMKAYSMHALSCIGSKDSKMVQSYLKYLKDPDLEMIALGHMKFFGKTAVDAAPEIAAYLSSKDAVKRRYAAECLGYLGNDRDDIIQQLRSASRKDSDSQVRARAEASLKRLRDRQSP